MGQAFRESKSKQINEFSSRTAVHDRKEKSSAGVLTNYWWDSELMFFEERGRYFLASSHRTKPYGRAKDVENTSMYLR